MIFKKGKNLLKGLSDESYIRLYYFLRFKKLINLTRPTTYNEKLNYLKLTDRNPDYVPYVDKLMAKEKAKELLGEDYVAKVIKTYHQVEDIDLRDLPESFVLKTTHDSSGVVICKDKARFSWREQQRKLDRSLRQNFYYMGREWPYKHIEPRIFAEEYLEDQSTKELRDYKFFCFDGEPRLMFIASGRANNKTTFDFYDMNFQHLPIRQHYPNHGPVEKPEKWEEMIEVAKICSKGLKHVRIDLYQVNGEIYFGEWTFYHFSGFMPFEPQEWDDIIGAHLDLGPDFSQRE